MKRLIFTAFLVICLTSTAQAAGRSRKKAPAPTPVLSPIPFPTPVALPPSDPQSPTDTHVAVERETESFSKKLGVTLESELSEEGTGVETSLSAKILGKKRSLVQYNNQASSDLSEGKSEVFINGSQLASIQLPLNGLGYELHKSIAPMQAKVSVTAVPVGPLLIKIDAGFALEADLMARVVPFLGIPFDESFLQVQVVPRLLSQAYAEGSLSYVVVRGGVGGAVTLADVDMQTYAQVFVKNTPPIFLVSGTMEFFSGSFYGFLQYFNPLLWSWSDIWRTTIHGWDGHCYKFNGLFETSGKCVR